MEAKINTLSIKPLLDWDLNKNLVNNFLKYYNRKIY